MLDTSATHFPDLDIDTAPPAARRAMQSTVSHLGYLSAAVARMAAAPQLLDAFFKATALFDASSLDPMAREVVVLTIATRNRCHICVAMHTARLHALDAPAGTITDLRAGRALEDERLEAVRTFTLDVLAAAGAVDDQAMQAFLDHGFTAQNALDVVLGIGTYTMSTLANRMTAAPVDDALAAFAWTPAAD